MTNLKPQSKLSYGLATIGLIFTCSLVFSISAKVNQVSGSIKEIIETNTNSTSHWFSYQVEMEPNNGMPCCYSKDEKSECSLTKRTNHWGSINHQQPTNSSVMDIYIQTQKGQVNDLFLAGSECPVNRSDLVLTELTNVSQAQSVAFLGSLLTASEQLSNRDSKRVVNQALSGIALHRGEKAHQVLESLVESSHQKLADDAIFWLGEARNKAGYQTLIKIVDDTSQPLNRRKKTIFALAVNKTLESNQKLLSLAKSSTDEDIKAESLFWIAERKIVGAYKLIIDTLESTSSEKIKDKAVFALSQIDTQESWDSLKELALNHHSVEVQKQAVFWLSQDHQRDPLDFLMSIAVGKLSKSVREQAVFAIAQLASGSAARGLIKLIETSDERFIKQKAIFWLGQIDDPKATDFVDAILLATNQ